ncbi:sigma-70 family RNA polymerase sigma factor [Amycolatopsis palatopharyngis]|uniref:sigma-70 family RNA polymerase sigma factor n=1 Tax=Amycolatopsis palatopharyngis TaxID=187982 RepID=UPI000E278E93|nr:sigma-70 family RNA polymerase sigma factor [Amycolatopsis palatopharyngis]
MSRPRLRAVRAHSGEQDLRLEDGIRAAYDAHGAELYRFAVRQLRDEGAAQDVVQEVFVRAWRNADTFDPAVASLRVWLFAIARHAVIDQVRRTRARVTLVSEDHLGQAGESTPGFDEAVMTGWLLEEALRRLTPEHRGAVVHTYLRGRSYAEVAAEQGVPVGTLRSRVFYGLKALRLALDEMGVEP